MDPSQPDGQPSHQPEGQPPHQPHAPQHSQHSHPAYQYQPYYPYQQIPGHPATPVTPPMNGFSIASLVTGIVCCLPPLGLVFGLIAFSGIRKRGQRGRGMAVAGTVLSSISTLLLAVALATGAAGDLWDDIRNEMDEASRSVSTQDLETGDCFNLPGTGAPEEKEIVSVRTVDCGTEHEAEIAGDFEVTGLDGYPGEKHLGTLADDRCQVINDAYALDPWEIHETVDYYFYLPTKESWRLGDKSITCGFAITEGGRVTGSVRRDPTNLNPDQLAYLRAESAIATVAYRAPDEDFAQDAVGHRTWARKMAAAFAGQAGALRAYDWPQAAAGPADRRAAEFDRARLHWDKAAAARDEERFRDHSGDADSALTQLMEISLRASLGLETTPPRHDPGDAGSESL
ncbi:DUF4190 domain-containing protein [Streptomyces sp. NPDC055078]